MERMTDRKTEIGSEFWDVPTCDGAKPVFPETTQWYLSGRSALKAIIRELGKCRTVAMPSWCCDSMVKPFADAGMEVRFYPVHMRKGCLVRENSFDCDVLFLMDYFGYTFPAVDMGSYGGVVIRDVTHSLFSAVYTDADYSFGSLRKWCGVWTGGYAWTKDGHPLPMERVDDHGYIDLRNEAMLQKQAYIDEYGNGGDSAVTDKGYLRLFSDAEELLESIGIAPAANRDVSLALWLDADLIRFRRRANAEVLRRAFAERLIFPELKDTDCPMFVPILVPDGRRNALRQFLINQEIFCPVHWPISGYHCLCSDERSLYESELSLVCDQRYTGEDMVRMAEAINTFLKET